MNTRVFRFRPLADVDMISSGREPTRRATVWYRPSWANSRWKREGGEEAKTVDIHFRTQGGECCSDGRRWAITEPRRLRGRRLSSIVIELEAGWWPSIRLSPRNCSDLDTSSGELSPWAGELALDAVLVVRVQKIWNDLGTWKGDLVVIGTSGRVTFSPSRLIQ